MPTCHVATFGCRVNQADSEAIVETLAARDLHASSSHADADVVVINSCTVTHRSDADIRKLVNRVNRDNPGAKVIVTGCYAQRAPEALVQLGGTSAVVGHSDAHRLGEVVDQLLHAAPQAPIVLVNPIEDADLPPIDPVAVVHERTRPFVKIQDGCDAACTYCIIPSVRGGARSADAGAVVGAVQRLVDDGYFEVVLTGVHLGTFRGPDDQVIGGRASRGPGEPLLALVARVLDEVPALGRLRLSCIEPMAFPGALAALAKAEPRLAPHFHLPLQSGSDHVLKRMGRPYRAAELRAVLDDIRAAVPHACLGTDVIVGFPGETDEDFEASCRFVEDAHLSYVHVFSYSDRPGVASTRLGSKVDPRIVKARSQRLNQIGRRLWARYLAGQVGRVLSALTLGPSKRAAGSVEALSDTYCPIRLPADQVESNRCHDVEIVDSDGEMLTGRLIS